MSFSARIKRHPVKAAVAAIGIVLLLAGVVVAIDFKRNLDNVVVWEDLHYFNLFLSNYLLEHKNIPLSEDVSNPTDISTLAVACREDWPYGKMEKACLDRWGTPMMFFAIRLKEETYHKGISAGKDRLFNTVDDIIDSEYDDSGNIFHPHNRLRPKDINMP
ncbi:MAG: hypothetical protein J5743_08840 [Victivallales bacterium]|nr:hypothetical protein [Victivallales bacterium]